MNERIRQVLWHLRQSKGFFGRRCLRWMMVAASGVLLLTVVEFAIAIFLQLFVVALGVSRPDMLPSWLPSQLVKASLLALLAGLLGIGVLRFCAYMLAELSSGTIQELLQARFRMLVLYDLLFAEDDGARSSAEVHHQIGEITPNVGQFALFVTHAFVYGALCLLIFAVMCVLFPWEALIGGGGLFGIGLLILGLNRKARQDTKVLPSLFKTIEQGIVRVAKNFFLIRVLQTQHREHVQFAKLTGQYYQASVRALMFSALATNIAPLLGLVLLVILIFLSQQVFGTPGLQLMAFLYLFIRFIQQIKLFAFFFGEVSRRWARYAEAISFYDSIPEDQRRRAWASYETLTWKDMSLPDVPLLPDALEDELPPSLRVEGLSYGYPGASKLIFDDLSFAVSSGEHFGIVGRSGAGKSTLLGLILGLLSPSKGVLELGGASPSTYLAEHRAVGYVGPEPFLWAGSVRENLLYGAVDERSEADMWQVLEQVGLRGVIEALPEQLDATLSEWGEGLSAGEKQRLSLARALLRQPTLLILDEASANLDRETEQEIADVIGALGTSCTVLIVSHREGLLQHTTRSLRLASK